MSTEDFCESSVEQCIVALVLRILTVFLSILLFPAETVPVHDIHRFCRLLYRYARRDTASGVKRFHWPSYKKAIDQHALSDVSYSRYTTARTDAPAASVQDIAVYAADVLAGQTGPIVDVGSLAHIMLERRLFNFEAARNARWASFLKTPAEHCVASGWELRVVLVLPPEVAASPTEFACVVSTIRVEAAVGPDQTAWVSLEDGMVEEPAVTVDVMHCCVSKLSQQLEVGM